MDALLMLGIIPGTNIQIDFDMWLRSIVVLCGLLICWLLFRSRLRIALFVALMTLHWHDPAAKLTARAA